MERPILKEATKKVMDEGDLLNFCNKIVIAHCMEGFNGIFILSDFMKDVANKLNTKKHEWS